MQHLTPEQAHQFLISNPEAVFIDVRSEIEHMFVGHPENSMLAPWVDGPDWGINPDFVAHVKNSSANRPVVLVPLRQMLCGCRNGIGKGRAARSV